MNNTIINPATGRAVNRYGPTGQQVLKNRRTQRGGSKKRSPRHNSSRKSQRRKSRSKTGGGSNQTGNSWITAVAKARKQLGIKGFQAVRKDTPLYKKAKQIQVGGTSCAVWRMMCRIPKACTEKQKADMAERCGLVAPGTPRPDQYYGHKKIKKIINSEFSNYNVLTGNHI